MTDSHAVRSLAALSQATRLQVFRALVGAGPPGLTPTRLSESLDIAPTALSFHLKELLNAGLVTQERDGRNLIYRPALGVINELLGFLTDHCCQGAPCAMVSTSCRVDRD